MYDLLLMDDHQSVRNVDQHLNILVLHQVVHFDLVPQRKLAQLKQDVNVVAYHSTLLNDKYFSPK